MISKLRYDTGNNSVTSPVNWQGHGTISEWETTKPTRFYVEWHHPELWECFCIRYYDSVKERTAAIREILKYYRKFFTED